jgi:gluconokinase
MSKANTAKKDCVITIDLGTSAVRVLGFDLNGNLVGSAKAAYPTFHPKPEYSEQDPEQLFVTMLYLLKNFLNETIYEKNYHVLSICFSAAMHSVLAIDKNGVPLGNVITWADNRGKQEAGELKKSALGKKIYKATGTPIHPMSPLIKITWMKNRDKERFKKAFMFLSMKSYIIQQLTGQYIIDYSLASATGLFNMHTLQWDTEALAYAGISSAKLPSLVSVLEVSGKLLKEYQTLFGLSADTKIIAGSSDGCMATIGAGVWGEGKATITIEDSGAMRVMGKEILKDDKQRFFNYVLTEGYYVSGGPTNNGGVIFEWFAKQFGNFKNAFDIDNCIEELMKDASKVATGSEGLLFLPYLLGERAPIWNANARGVYFGLNINHEQKHFIRATIEGILYEMYSIGKTLEEHRSIKSLSVNGSFATIPFCSQMIADIFNKPVGISKSESSVGLGSFLLSATEMGIYKNLDAAVKSVEVAETFKPNKKANGIYKEYAAVFGNLSTKFNAEFEAISNLQQKNM